MTPFSFRLLCLLGFGACAFGIAFALMLQQLGGYEPCAMCIFQRIAMIGAGLLFLAGAAHAPARAGRWIYAVLAAFATGIGAGIAGRQVWLQQLPADRVPACGPTLDYLLDMFPLTEVVTMILKGDGNCAKIDAQWLGITLPGWTLIAFLGLTLFALALPILSRKPPP
jgi:disulfide bond formation protein DsbB